MIFAQEHHAHTTLGNLQLYMSEEDVRARWGALRALMNTESLYATYTVRTYAEMFRMGPAVRNGGCVAVGCRSMRLSLYQHRS